ncbi:hypothetical protein NDU88_005901 [Pleurodeles waltl]|uniref:Uncharacterized protein n=1 Tax=Pleurodeles waltl TaxID=8319 RepID=A0AAV7LMF9_PLEWA|nr:hypothetical protein NDU88_005901 [Pleurodeles waltl]
MNPAAQGALSNLTGLRSRHEVAGAVTESGVTDIGDTALWVSQSDRTSERLWQHQACCVGWVLTFQCGRQLRVAGSDSELCSGTDSGVVRSRCGWIFLFHTRTYFQGTRNWICRNTSVLAGEVFDVPETS